MILQSIDEISKIIIPELNFEKAEQETRFYEYDKLCKFLIIKSNRTLLKSLYKQYDKDYSYNQQLTIFYSEYSGVSIPHKCIENGNKTKEFIEFEKNMIKYLLDYDKSIDRKIVNRAEKWGTNEKYVEYALMHDDNLKKEFAKDPSKQTMHQHLVANWMKNIPCIENFREPENHGSNAYYIYEGNIIRGSELNSRDVGKSIDFTWEYTFGGKTLYFYATHKHTKVSGGSQDNQFEDVCTFHKNAKLCTNKNIILLSITDGQYYLDRFSKYTASNVNKIEYMNLVFNGPRNKATNSENLVKCIIPEIKKWLLDNFNYFDIAEELSKLDSILSLFYHNN